MEISLKIKELLIKNNSTPKELGEHLGLSVQNIYNYLNGKSKPPVDKLNIMADFFKVNVSELINSSDSNNSLFTDRDNFWKDKFEVKSKELEKLEIEYEYLKQKFDQVLVKY